MGFWDARLADLEAVGETFTDEEIRVLEEGGDVLHLHPLETPDYETRDWLTYQGSSDLVLLPEIIKSVPLNSQVEHYVYVKKGDPIPTVKEYLNEHGGWFSLAGEWTDIPRYAGVLDTEHELYCSNRCEEVTGYVYWNCLPVQPDDDVVKQILLAGQQSMNTGLWHEYYWFTQVAYEDEYDPVMPWIVVNHPDQVEPEDRDQLMDAMLCSYGGEAQALEGMRCDAEAMQTLLDARVLDLYGPEFGHLGHGEDTVSLPFPRLEDQLEANGHYEAADLIRGMTARRRMALTRQPKQPHHYRQYDENEVLD